MQTDELSGQCLGGAVESAIHIPHFPVRDIGQAALLMSALIKPRVRVRQERDLPTGELEAVGVGYREDELARRRADARDRAVDTAMARVRVAVKGDRLGRDRPRGRIVRAVQLGVLAVSTDARC